MTGGGKSGFRNMRTNKRTNPGPRCKVHLFLSRCSCGYPRLPVLHRGLIYLRQLTARESTTLFPPQRRTSPRQGLDSPPRRSLFAIDRPEHTGALFDRHLTGAVAAVDSNGGASDANIKRHYRIKLKDYRTKS